MKCRYCGCHTELDETGYARACVACGRVKPVSTPNIGSKAMWNELTDNARTVLMTARAEATRMGHEYIGTEHLLLGLAKVGEGAAKRVLSAYMLDYPVARQTIDALLGIESPETEARNAHLDKMDALLKSVGL